MSDHTDPQLVFTLGTGESPDVRQDLLGLWQTSHFPEASSFSAKAVPNIEGTMWVADLPTNLARANHVMKGAEQRLTVSSQAMVIADDRLASFAQQHRVSPGFSFATAPGEPEQARPEDTLEQLLLEVSRDQAAVNYGLLDKLTGGLSMAEAQFEAFLERLTRMVVNYACVETRGEGQPLARTVVSWSGNADTFWRSRLLASQTKLHQRTVRLALESRQELLRTLTFVSRSAVRLAKLPVLLSTPGGAILALPLAWRFFEDVREELERHQA